MLSKEQLNLEKIPQHIAIIMDGNGRWAKRQGKSRSAGHQAGVEAVRNIVKEASELGVKFLTLYTFSTENWNRPPEEVTALMNLLLDSIEEEIFMKNNVSFRAIGNLKQLPENVQKRLQQCIQRTSVNTGMCMVIALSYSSKWEITNAVKQILHGVTEGKISENDITPDIIENHLDTAFMPNPDLLIRTGGEIRLSNYLLWQCAYTELYFCETFWPDFNKEELYKAIDDYQKRERRYGKISEQI